MGEEHRRECVRIEREQRHGACSCRNAKRGLTTTAHGRRDAGREYDHRLQAQEDSGTRRLHEQIGAAHRCAKPATLARINVTDPALNDGR
jgi:hypothetical protein